MDVGEDEITAKVTVTNTGDMAGKSVVQLYAPVSYTHLDVYKRQAGNRPDRPALRAGSAHGR